jgi:hypothetical protein
MFHFGFGTAFGHVRTITSMRFCHSNNTALLFGVGVFDTNRSDNRLVFPPEDGYTKSRISVDAYGLKRPRSVGMVLSSEPAALLFPPSRNK